MSIVEYKEKYRKEASLLLVELQLHLSEIDDENVQTVSGGYLNHYLDYVLDTVNSNNGKLYLAVENQKAIGLIAGIIEPKDNEDKLCTRCPVRGVITELIVSRNSRKKGVGKQLFSAMEAYFTSITCEFISVNVFAPNLSAASFYKKMGCKQRNIEMIKRIDSIPRQRYSYHSAALQDIEYLWDRSIAENKNKTQWEAWKKQFTDDNKSGKALTFAVFDNNVPVGEGTLLFSPDCNAVNGRKELADNSTTANINALRIKKEYEGKGHISKLVREMENYALYNGYTYLTIGVEASETRNLAIYLHWGYTEFVTSEFDNDALVIYYRKNIKKNSGV